MRISEHIEHLETEGARLAEAVSAAGLDAAVASCPEWRVRDLVIHVGGVHRWAASIVGKELPDETESRANEVGTGPDGDVLLDWFLEGHRELVQTLRRAPSDLDCFTFLPAPSPLAFWARRQAHETAIHRADAECAAGSITPFGEVFALDGAEEILLGFAARPRRPLEPGTLAITTDDGAASWLATFGETGVTVAPSTAPVAADAAVTGSPSDLYLWLWNRPSSARVSGDPAIAARWREVRVRWS